MPVPIVALVCKAFVKEASQVNVSPLCTVAISLLPKLSNDQLAGSIVTVLVTDSSPYPTNSVMSVTVEPFACSAGEVPFMPRVMPLIVFVPVVLVV